VRLRSKYNLQRCQPQSAKRKRVLEQVQPNANLKTELIKAWAHKCVIWTSRCSSEAEHGEEEYRPNSKAAQQSRAQGWHTNVGNQKGRECEDIPTINMASQKWPLRSGQTPAGEGGYSWCLFFFFFSPSARRSSRYAIPNMGVSRKSPQEQREW